MGAWVSISPANPTAPVSTQHSTGHCPGECDADDTPPAQPPIIATQAQNATTGGLETSTNTIKQQRQQGSTPKTLRNSKTTTSPRGYPVGHREQPHPVPTGNTVTKTRSGQYQ